MESAEHMPNKKLFMNELFRVTAPNGRILIVTWCHRELKTDEEKLTDKEINLLAKINEGFFFNYYYLFCVDFFVFFFIKKNLYIFVFCIF
jgi:ubiquinone/menaquinone biosynthesis C-methylase UbiE